MKGYRNIPNISPISKGYKCGNRLLFLEIQLLQQDMTHSRKKAFHSQALAITLTHSHASNPNYMPRLTLPAISPSSTPISKHCIVLLKRTKKSTLKIKNVSRACIYIYYAQQTDMLEEKQKISKYHICPRKKFCCQIFISFVTILYAALSVAVG